MFVIGFGRGSAWSLDEVEVVAVVFITVEEVLFAVTSDSEAVLSSPCFGAERGC